MVSREELAHLVVRLRLMQKTAYPKPVALDADTLASLRRLEAVVDREAQNIVRCSAPEQLQMPGVKYR